MCSLSRDSTQHSFFRLQAEEQQAFDREFLYNVVCDRLWSRQFKLTAVRVGKLQVLEKIFPSTEMSVWDCWTLCHVEVALYLPSRKHTCPMMLLHFQILQRWANLSGGEINVRF